MRCRLGLVLALLPVAGHASPSTEPVPAELGTWLTANGKAVVAITRCGDGLCGALVGLTKPTPDAIIRDIWHRPECGETILQMPQRGEDGRWHGSVLDPRDGSQYHAELWLRTGQLHLRGYLVLPVLGQTQAWRPYVGKLGADCTFTQNAT